MEEVKITRAVKVDPKDKPLTVEEKQAQEKAVREFYAGAYVFIQKLLNRDERTHVSNITVNTVIQACKAKGDKKASEILDRLDNCKPAKSIDDLLMNISKGYTKGTRTDGVDLDFTGIEF